MQRRLAVLAQMPEQPLLVDVFGDAPQRALPQPPEQGPRVGRFFAPRAPSPLLLGLRQHVAEAIEQTTKETPLLVRIDGLGVLGGLAIGLEAAPADGDQVDIKHRSSC